MFIQWCLKGIRSRPPSFGDLEAFSLLDIGILSNWLLHSSTMPIVKALVTAQGLLSQHALLTHVNQYSTVVNTTPYVSLSAGVILRDAVLGRRVHPAWKSAVDFATARGKVPGYVYRVWTVVTPKPSPKLINLSDEIRNLNLFRDAWKWQHQGEITAKLVIPSSQIQSVTKVNANGSLAGIQGTNPNFVDPQTICNLLKEINA
jgi:hypothetical protein